MRDLAAAEDALADAFAAALRHWPEQGVPDAPEPWLAAAAQRRLLHHARHIRLTLDPRVTALLDEAEPEAPERQAVPDARLQLMFVCAKPETAADAAAAEFCMSQRTLDSFVEQVKPYFSEEKVMTFARGLGVHPGLVVGHE